MTETTEAPFPWQIPPNPGPTGNVPRIALPGCMGLLNQYHQEWWYYVGWARSDQGEEFSLQFQCLRAAIRTPELAWQVAAAPVGIGVRSTGGYLWAPGYGLGVSETPGSAALTVLPATDGQYGVHLTPISTPLGPLGSEVGIAYTGGAPLATPGSTYRITASGTPLGGAPFSADLSCVDRRGLVMEGESGYVGGGVLGTAKGGGAGSYEFAQPLLSITGGALTLGGTRHKLAEGWLWCDRQVVTHPPAAPAPQLDPARPDLALGGGQPLYRGSWMGIALDNGVTMALATFWQPPPFGGLQWQTGTAVGRPPRSGFGTVYLPLDGNVYRNGSEPLRGSGPAGASDFDINIVDAASPEQSPHWQSPVSGHTYCTGWRISFHPRLAPLGVPSTLVLRALVDGCENLLPDASNAFWEGAAAVYTEDGRPVGHAFVEQMGFD